MPLHACSSSRVTDEIKTLMYGYLPCFLYSLSLPAVAAVSACPELGDPVCGADGLTYWNECLATLQNVKITKKGYCEGELRGLCCHQVINVCSQPP
jgi:hypothetical protein